MLASALALGATRHGNNHTPNDLFVAGARLVRGWWSAHPNVGAWTPDNASVPADQSTWDSNLEVTVGGSNAVKATTNSSRHYCYESAPTAVISSYCDIDVSDCVAQGSQVWVRVWAGADYCNVNLSTGAEGNKSGADVSCTSGVVAFRSVAARDCRVELLEPALGDDATATPSAYVGSTSDGYTGDVTFDQPRVSAVADLSKLPTSETLRGAHLEQGTGAKQPLKGFASQNGQALFYHEVGRDSGLSVADAEVLAALSGDDPAFAIAGVFAFGASSNHESIIVSLGAGGARDDILARNGTDLLTRRHDGSTASQHTFGSNLAALLATPQAIAVIRKANRQCELWIAGVRQDTVTLSDLASTTQTSFYVISAYGSGGTDTELTLGELALFAGDVTYSQIRNQGGLAAMAARWGVTA